MTNPRHAAALALALPLAALPLAAPGALGATAGPLGPGPAAASAAQEQGLGDLKAVRAEMLEKARELAEFADDVKADVERDQIYRCILELDPEDKDARKALGFSKSKGEWVFKKYKEPKSRAKDEDMAELAKRRAAVAEELAEKLDACFPTENPTARHRHERRLQFATLAMLDWHNQELRERADQAWDEQREEWRIEEVVVAKLDRALRRGLMNDLDANVPTGTRTEVDEAGKGTGIPFQTVIQCPRVLVASTGSPEEAQRILEIVHQAPDFLTQVFGIPDPWSDQQWRFYEMTDPNLRQQFYSRHPEFNGDAAGTPESGAVGFGQLCVGLSGTNAASRQDGAANQRVGQYLQAVFGADLGKGWVRAGLGLYLSYQLCDTRISLWIQRDEYGEHDGPDLGERLRDPSVDWLDEARLLLRRSSQPVNIVTVIGKAAKDLTAEDLLTSYAISAYLFEGRRADLIEILKRIGKGENPTLVFESQLGMPMDAFRERLIEWLGEMRKG